MSQIHLKISNYQRQANLVRPESSPMTDPQCPRLLVSVRSADEAATALRSGADILDVKEPAFGALAMAPLETIRSIAAVLKPSSSSIALSVALGEITDWGPLEKIPSLPDGITFAKLGLSGCRGDSSWKANWFEVRQEFQARTNSRLNWVAVAYADDLLAHSPAIEEIIGAAIESQCVGLLIDTWSKSRATMPDYFSASELNTTAKRCHSSGLFLALAGKLDLHSLDSLSDVDADLLAIRTAACQDGDRTKPIDATRLRQFKDQMKQVYARV